MEASTSGLTITNHELAGSDVVVEMASTTGLAINDLIYFGGANPEWTKIKAITVNTSITVDLATNKTAGDPVTGYDWDVAGSPSGEVIMSSAGAHSGSLGLELVNADDGEGIQQVITVISGQQYTFSFWEKNNAQDVEVILSGATTQTIDATGDNTWTKHSYTFEADSTSLTVKIASGAANQSGYFDDVSLVEVDEASASTELLYDFEAEHIKTSRLTGDVRIDDSLLVYPSANPGANARIIEGQDHNANTLFKVDLEGDTQIGKDASSVLTLNGIATLEGYLTIDVNNTEAFLVRKDGDAGDIFAVDTTNSRVGFFAAAPQAQQAHIIDADGTLADITTKFNTLLADLEGFGFLATS
jgi:hypothetical protein